MEHSIYRSSSVVVLTVGLSGLSVGNERAFWKNGRLDRDAVCGGGSSVPKESCIGCVCTLAPPANTVEQLFATAAISRPAEFRSGKIDSRSCTRCNKPTMNSTRAGPVPAQCVSARTGRGRFSAMHFRAVRFSALRFSAEFYEGSAYS